VVPVLNSNNRVLAKKKLYKSGEKSLLSIPAKAFRFSAKRATDSLTPREIFP
jgi:hypothetical protein